MKTNLNSIKKISKNKVQIFICEKANWNIQEVKLTELEIEKFNLIKNDARKNEFLGIRVLKNYADPSFEIEYLSSGKPFLINSQKQISISHSKNFIAFASADHPIGIDIEECNDRILKIKDRFLNESEKKIFNQSSISELTIAWCVKEALFKLNANHGIDFKNDLIIEEWDKVARISAKMQEDSKWKRVNLTVHRIENLVLCFNFE
jgi:4'-phosphopantetheinyl transferase